MQKTIDEALHMQAVKHPNRAEPEETSPAEQEITETERECNERNLQRGPNRIARAHQVRTPLLHTGGFPLIKPSEVCPPESAMTRTRYVIDGIGVRVVIAMICDPGAGSTGTVETGKKNQDL